MSDPETFIFTDDGAVPNSRLPLLVYRAALPADPAAIERAFHANDWGSGWRNGIFPYHHFHSTAHEVLGIAAGSARVRFGGPGGRTLEVAAGDVVVIPAGVGHCNEGQSDDLLVVGAYPAGSDYDTCRPDPAQHARRAKSAASVPVPETDPVAGRDGPLIRLWG